MTTMAEPSIGAPPTPWDDWEAVDWRRVSREVRRLQTRIAKAVREKRYGKAKALQWLLTHSFQGKLWAVRRVVRNRGCRTPGVDGVVWRTPEEKMQAARSLKRKGYKAQPLRRIYIPKKNRKRRPLSIPTMADRAQQALHLLALNPVAETTADPNSYGFRLERSTKDALVQCHTVLSRRVSAPWVFEGDIESCFDQISHSWLADNVLMDTAVLREWLAAGYLEDGIYYPTEGGTPQGGIASPVLANLALDGLERVAQGAAPPGSKVNVIRYADDFVITACSRELLEHKIIPAVEVFLGERGLRLSKEKSRITHIDVGFDFLGTTVRKYRGALYITPAKQNVLTFVRMIRAYLRRHQSTPTVEVIRGLNRKLRGWAHYYRHLVSSRVFRYIDFCVFRALWQWVRRRHPKKRARWLRRRYFRSQGLRNWVFTATPGTKARASRPVDLFRMGSLHIRRHIKVRSAATVFDPAYTGYFRQRWLQKRLQRRHRRFADGYS